MQWLIVGQGAIGSLMAASLQRSGNHVVLKLRQPQITSVAIVMQGAQHQFSTQNLPLSQPMHVFASIKAYSVGDFLDELKQWPLPAGSTLILSYNGMLDNEPSLLPSDTLHWVTTHGAYRDGPTVVHAGQGESWLGWAQPQQASTPTPETILQALNNALPEVHWSDSIQQRRWQKLAMNCLINPFTVIHQCRNGELPPSIRAKQHKLAEELVWLAHQHQLALNADELVQQAWQVIAQTAANYSSMYMDVKHQRRTEIDYLNGFVARQADQLGGSAPQHKAIWHRVRELSLD